MDLILHGVSPATFWTAVVQIVGVNIVLSGDNAVVIALACMSLPPRQRLWGMVLGAGIAVLLRVVFTLAVVQAMSYPYLRLVGGVLLIWVAIKLVTGDEGESSAVTPARTLWRAVRIVAVADIVMSLDNVIAIAAAAEAAAAGIDPSHAATLKAALILFGLATSIPLIVAGSAVLMALLARYRVLIWAGGALLGWIAGDIMATDPALAGFIGSAESLWHVWAARAGALVVVAIGLFSVSRQRRITMDDALAGIGIALWIAAGVGITHFIAPEAETLRWIARGLVAVVLGGGYLALRSGRRTGHEGV